MDAPIPLGTKRVIDGQLRLTPGSQVSIAGARGGEGGRGEGGRGEGRGQGGRRGSKP